MRIAIDARAWEWAGIGRYIRNLLAVVARMEHSHQFTVLVGTPRAAAGVRALLDSRMTPRLVEPSYYSWREQAVFWRQLQQLPLDLVHFTHFNVPLLYHGRSVVTIHDVTRFYFPGQSRQSLPRQVLYEHVFARAVRQAVGVLCVSETTRTALADLPLQLPSLTVVIPEGVEERFFVPPPLVLRQRLRAQLGFSGPYVLSAGVWMGHKNLVRVLAAFREVLRRQPQVRLVVTGRARAKYVDVPAEASRLGVPAGAVVYPGFVDEELLPALYAEAAVLLFPSLYEGFGLPALEALAAGTPVVAANVASLPEVVGEAGVLVNPEYVPGIARAVEQVLGDAAVRQRLQAAGRTRAHQFSWQECARRTLAVYEAAAGAR